mmetsp:Transcript_154136/g.492993  ORF Transcript_154136/g.492993 Transcript_154136/m.492993 type:complete len:229 (-) Transcript_154136:143-829(-)
MQAMSTPSRVPCTWSWAWPSSWTSPARSSSVGRRMCRWRWRRRPCSSGPAMLPAECSPRCWRSRPRTEGEAVRVLPSFPASLQPLDSLIGLLAFLATTHTAAILNGWVNKQAVHRVDTVFLPPLVNLPVAWHLLMDGQTWVEELSARYPGWPEAFFMSNCTLAWSASMVTFVLSLHERRVVSLEMRNGIMLGFPFIVFAIICARVGSLIPEWFQDDVWTIFTLSAPGN